MYELKREKRYWFFLPVQTDSWGGQLKVIHWSDNVDDFVKTVLYKRKVEEILLEDRCMRVVDPETKESGDFHLNDVLDLSVVEE